MDDNFSGIRAHDFPKIIHHFLSQKFHFVVFFIFFHKNSFSSHLNEIKWKEFQENKSFKCNYFVPFAIKSYSKNSLSVLAWTSESVDVSIEIISFSFFHSFFFQQNFRNCSCLLTIIIKCTTCVLQRERAIMSCSIIRMRK